MPQNSSQPTMSLNTTVVDAATICTARSLSMDLEDRQQVIQPDNVTLTLKKIVKPLLYCIIHHFSNAKSKIIPARFCIIQREKYLFMQTTQLFGSTICRCTSMCSQSMYVPTVLYIGSSSYMHVVIWQ